MARKDIEVRVKARDDASRHAEKIASALKRISTDGEKAAKGASNVGSAFGGLSANMSKLQGSLGNLKGFASAVGQMDKAASSVEHLEKQLDSSIKGFSGVRERTQQAAKASEDLRSKIEREEAALALRNRYLDDATAKQKANTEALKAAQRAQEALNGAKRKGVETAGNTPSRGVGLESGAPRSSAKASFSAFLNADIANAEAEKNRLTGVISGLTSAVDASKGSIKGYRTELRAAEAVEKEFADETTRAGNAVLATRADLVRAQSTLASLKEKSDAASTGLGGLAANQAAVEQATRKASAELKAMEARVAGLSGKQPTVLDRTVDKENNTNRRAQLENLRALRDEYTKAQASAQALGKAMASADEPTDELGAAFGRARAQVAQLKIAINEQRAALRTTGSFASLGGGASGSGEAAAMAAAAQQLGQIAPMAQRAAGAKQQLASATDKASASLSLFGENTRTTLSYMQRLRGEALSVATSFVGLYAAFERGRAAVDSFKAMETAQARLGVAFSGDTRLIGQEIAWLNGQADRLGYTFGSLAGGYGKISVAAQAAGFSVRDTRDLFSSLSVAARVNNTSLDEMNGVLRAVEQMMSKGKIQAEELRGQLGDRMTAAFQTFSTALGMTTQELDEALKKGEVYANRETMLKFAERLNQMYGSRLPASMQTLSYSLGQFERDAEKANLAIAQGLVPSLQKVLAGFHDFANSAEGQKTFENIGIAAGKLIGLLAQVPKYFDLIIVAAKAFVAVKVAQWVSGLGTSLATAAAGFATYGQASATAAAQGERLTMAQRLLTAGLITTTNSMAAFQARLLASASATGAARIGVVAFAATLGGLRSLMLGIAAMARSMWVALGGPVGIAIAGISLLMMNWKSDANKATEALQAHERQLEAVKKAYEAVSGSSEDWRKKVVGTTLAEAESTLKALEDQYNSWLKGLQGMSNPVRSVYETAQASPFMRAGISDKDLSEMKTYLDLIDNLKAGKIGIEDFRREMDALYASTTHDGLKRIAKETIEMTSASKDGAASAMELSKSMENQRNIVSDLRGDTNKLRPVLVETNKAFDKSALVNTYSDAIKDLKEKIPSLADEMRKLKDITELNETAWKGLQAAWKAGDYGKIAEITSLWAQGQTAIAKAAQDKQMDAFGAGNSDVIQRIIYVEGGQNGTGPGTSSARGIGQFTEGTWLGYFDQIYPELKTLNETQKLALRTSEDHATKILTAFTKDNQAALLRAGVNAGPTETYLAHFLGAGDAIKVLLANPDELASKIVNPKSVAANKSVFTDGLTARDLINWSASKMGGVGTRGTGITGTGQTDTEKRIADQEFELSQQKLINAEKQKEAAIEAALRAAREENPNITDEQIAKVKELAAANYDAANGERMVAEAQKNVNDLYSARQRLVAQYNEAIKLGDYSKAESVKGQLQGVNQQLGEAIDKAIEFYKALGGPNADAAIAKLRAIPKELALGQKAMGAFGLQMNTWKSIFDSAISGIVGIFDKMAQAIASGENAWQAFGTAALQVLAEVLKQIALAIIKQMILNALIGFGGPIGTLAGQAGGVATGHTGGIVGSNTIGTGNSIRPTGWVSNAYRGVYHTGGVAGFAPDEVSATLKKNEEILTEQDPRHRFNLGGEKSSAQSTRLKQVLAIGDDEIANAMAGAHGERVQLTTIKRNAPTIRRMLGL